MAVRALAALDPTYDAREELQREIDDCIDLTTGKSIVTAAGRGELRTNYACGAVFWLVMEAVAEKDVFGVLSDLIADNPEGVLTRQEWLDHLDLVSNDMSLSYDIDRLLDQGAADPAILIASLMRRAGVDFQMIAGQPELD